MERPGYGSECASDAVPGARPRAPAVSGILGEVQGGRSPVHAFAWRPRDWQVEICRGSPKRNIRRRDRSCGGSLHPYRCEHRVSPNTRADLAAAWVRERDARNACGEHCAAHGGVRVCSSGDRAADRVALLPAPRSCEMARLQSYTSGRASPHDGYFPRLGTCRHAVQSAALHHRGSPLGRPIDGRIAGPSHPFAAKRPSVGAFHCTARIQADLGFGGRRHAN